jgi:DNA repair exonuclease SbcCD ATPase subunit
MKIRSLELKDFGNTTSQRLVNLPDSVALFGFNGQGKTTALHAIQWLLFGFCERTLRNGKDSEQMIRDGAKEAQLSCVIELAEDYAVRLFATIKKRGSNEWGCCMHPNGEVIDGVEDRDGFWKFVGIPKAHAEVAAFPMQMLRSKKLSDPLADFLSTAIDIARLTDLCGEHLPWLKGFAQGRAGGIVHAVLSGQPGAVAEAKHFEEIGQAAFDLRRDKKAELKGEKYQIDAAAFVAPPKDGNGNELTVDRLPALEQQLGRLHATLDALHVDLGRAQNAPDPAAVAEQRTAAEAALNAAIATEAEFRTEAERLRAELAVQDARVSEALSAQGKLLTEASTIGNALAVATKDLEEITQGNGPCPTCGQKLAKAVRDEIVKPRAAKVEDLKAQHAAALSQHEAALAALQPLRDAVKALRETTEAAEAKARTAAAATTTAQAAFDAVPALYDGEGAADIQAKIETQRAQLERCTDAVAKLRAIKEREQNAEYVKAAETEIEQLDWCVKAFKDGEVLKQLLGSPVEAFTARCNGELEPLGYELGIQADGKALKVMLRCPGALTARPIEHCSAGQQTLAAIAIAGAFCDTGAPVLIDDLNQLDPANRGAVLMHLKHGAMGSVMSAGPTPSWTPLRRRERRRHE